MRSEERRVGNGVRARCSTYHEKQNTANVLNNIGEIYFNRGNFIMAVENFSRAIKIYETEGDKLGIAIDLINIGEVYASQ